GTFLISGVFLSWVGGKLRWSLRAAQDARREAEQAVRARDEFISIVAHELKNPVTTLRLQAQLGMRHLNSRENTPPDERAFYERILVSSEGMSLRILRLIDDLLDFSRTVHGKLRVDFESVDLSRLASRVLDQFAPELEAKRIVLYPQVEMGLAACCDPGRI